MIRRYDDGERERGSFDFEAAVFVIAGGKREYKWLYGDEVKTPLLVF